MASTETYMQSMSSRIFHAVLMARLRVEVYTTVPQRVSMEHGAAACTITEDLRSD